uniref:SPRY domain-containing protein 7 n=1 Tax=Eubosmina coregoni TaxID=186181 RepID=A0A4Y7LRZ5_9CRUS|nr:EOG090X0EPP [Eubosmina coregoni]SVE70093.1 EOG090X0EPP [Eubosmina coregoni]
MASIFCCFRGCSKFLDLGLTTQVSVQVPVKPLICLNNSSIGQEVVLVKNGSRICGTGASLANVAIMQDKAYFEVRLQQSGVWSVGLGTEKADLNNVLGGDADSWVLCSDGSLRHKNEEMHRITQLPQEGDTIGVSYNHIELNFFLNGQKLDCPFTNVKGQLYPAVYVDEGAVLDVVFEDFAHGPPSGYDKIMLEQSLLET